MATSELGEMNDIFAIHKNFVMKIINTWKSILNYPSRPPYNINIPIFGISGYLQISRSYLRYLGACL